MKLNKSIDCYTGDITLFGRTVRLVVERESEPGPTQLQKLCIKTVEAMSSNELEEIAKWATKYSERINLTEEDYNPRPSTDSRENEYYFDQVTIPRLGSSEVPIYTIEGECRWEEEHGLLVAFFGKEIIYCGEIIAPSMSKRKWTEMLESGSEQRKKIGELFPSW